MMLYLVYIYMYIQYISKKISSVKYRQANGNVGTHYFDRRTLDLLIQKREIETYSHFSFFNNVGPLYLKAIKPL